jgi:hypothetical protein
MHACRRVSETMVQTAAYTCKLDSSMAGSHRNLLVSTFRSLRNSTTMAKLMTNHTPNETIQGRSHETTW